MNPSTGSLALAAHPASRFQLHVWHIGLLVLYAAIATADILDHTRREPFLMAMASAGLAGYAVLGWLGWCRIRRLQTRLGATTTLVLYLISMAAFFLMATAAYLVVEYAYLTGDLYRLGRWAGLGVPSTFRRPI
jgi:hypothetical protein